MIKRLSFALILFVSLLLASGEEVVLGREVRTVYIGQSFTVSVTLPDQDKYPEYYYTTVDPMLNTEFVEYLRMEGPEPRKNVYYFKAVKPGETNINIYRRKVGKNATNGLEYSLLVKVSK